MMITKHFSVREMTKSMTASRLGISNSYLDADHAIAMEIGQNIEALCVNVLEPVRAHFGKPVRVNSGYRSPKLNKTIGGSRSSQHMTGQAADIEIDGEYNPSVAAWIFANLDFDQLILECYEPGEPNSGWVHVSYKLDGVNRKEVLTAYRDGNGRMRYKHGLHA